MAHTQTDASNFKIQIARNLGHSINKLQNGIILLIFKVRKILNDIFCIHCEYDDVTVASLMMGVSQLWKYVNLLKYIIKYYSIEVV